MQVVRLLSRRHIRRILHLQDRRQRVHEERRAEDEEDEIIDFSKLPGTIDIKDVLDLDASMEQSPQPLVDTMVADSPVPQQEVR